MHQETSQTLQVSQQVSRQLLLTPMHWEPVPEISTRQSMDKVFSKTVTKSAMFPETVLHQQVIGSLQTAHCIQRMQQQICLSAELPQVLQNLQFLISQDQILQLHQFPQVRVEQRWLLVQTEQFRLLE